MTAPFLSLSLVTCCAGLLSAADVVEKMTANIDGAALARTGIDRAWTVTALGATYESRVIDRADLDTSSVHARWTRERLSVWGAARFNVRSNPDGGRTTNGFGDCEAGASFAQPLSPTMRGVGGLDAVFGTSEDDELGGNAMILRPFVAFSLLKDQHVSASAEVGYAFDAGKENGVDDTSVIDLRLTTVAMLPHDAFVWARVTPGYDEDDDFILSVSGGVGLLSGERHTVRIETEQAIDSDRRDRQGWVLRLYYAWML